MILLICGMLLLNTTSTLLLYVRRLLSGSRDKHSYLSSVPGLNAANWSTLLLSFIPFNPAGLGVNGFGYF